MRFKAEMTGGAINNLPDSAFAYIEPGGSKDEQGKTIPRSNRHFPIHDAAHVRNALSRAPQSPFGSKAMPKIKAAAKRFGIDVSDDTEGKGSLAAGDASRASMLLSSVYDLISCEAGEDDQVEMLQRAAQGIHDFIDAETKEIGATGDIPDMEGMYATPMKAWQLEMKAEPLTTAQLDLWLAGERGRGVLVVPYGGPLPGGKAGLDLDGDFFDEDTDLYGQYPSLRATRERLVDWHHDSDPIGTMKGAILGRVILEEKAASDGLWGDFWANAGEKRRNLMAALERQGVPLYGSSEAIGPAIRKSKLDIGTHIDVWPLIRHTITTSPQNTFAVVPPLKALLASNSPSAALSIDAIRAAMLEQSAPSAPSPTGAGNASGNGLSQAQESVLRDALDVLTRRFIHP